MSIQVAFVKCVDTQPELLRLAAHFVERGQTVVNVEHRVLESLRHDRPRELLEFEHEMHVLFACLRIQVFRKPESRMSRRKLKIDSSIAGLRRLAEAIARS